MPALRRMTALAVLALAGCSDAVYDQGLVPWVMGDPPPPAGSPLIRTLSGKEAEYPNLATVPSRPTDIPTLQQRQRDMDALARDRSAAKSAASALAKVAPVPPTKPPAKSPAKPGDGLPVPVEVPPAPNLKPGGG